MSKIFQIKVVDLNGIHILSCADVLYNEPF